MEIETFLRSVCACEQDQLSEYGKLREFPFDSLQNAYDYLYLVFGPKRLSSFILEIRNVVF